MLAHAKAQVAAQAVLGGIIASALNVTLVGGGQVGRSAHQVGHQFRQFVQHIAGAAAGGLRLFLMGQQGGVRKQAIHGHFAVPGIPLRRQFGELPAVFLKHRLPFLAGFDTVGQAVSCVLIHVLIHLEGLARHPQRGLGLGQIVLAQRLAVGAGLALLGRAAIADEGGADDQDGLVRVLGLFKRGQYLVRVVAVLYLDNLPAIG